jgi:hypothetical protein
MWQCNHYNYIKQVYQGLMVDYLIFLTLDEDYPLTLLIYNTGVSTVIKCLHLVSNIRSTPRGLHTNDRERVFWERIMLNIQTLKIIQKMEITCQKWSKLISENPNRCCNLWCFIFSQWYCKGRYASSTGKQLPHFKPSTLSSKCQQPFTGTWGVTPKKTCISHHATCLLSTQNLSWTQARTL